MGIAKKCSNHRNNMPSRSVPTSFMGSLGQGVESSRRVSITQDDRWDEPAVSAACDKANNLSDDAIHKPGA